MVLEEHGRAAAGTETIRVIGDLMIAEDVERIVAETEAAFGSVDQT